MKLHFTFGERTAGLFKAALVLNTLFTVLAVIIALSNIPQIDPESIRVILWFLLIAVIVTFVSCQLFGQPIWFIGDLLGLNSIFTTALLGMITGAVMLISYALMLTDSPNVSLGFAAIFTGVGMLCGIVAFHEASKRRRVRVSGATEEVKP